MSPLKSYRELRVWQKAMELVRECYAIRKKLPADERYVLSAQLRGSAVSVPANIVEGYARRKRGEYLYFLSVARSSLEEAECHLHSIEQAGLLPACQLERARSWLTRQVACCAAWNSRYEGTEEARASR